MGWEPRVCVVCGAGWTESQRTRRYFKVRSVVMIVEFRSNSQSITSIPSRKVDLYFEIPPCTGVPTVRQAGGRGYCCGLSAIQHEITKLLTIRSRKIEEFNAHVCWTPMWVTERPEQISPASSPPHPAQCLTEAQAHECSPSISWHKRCALQAAKSVSCSSGDPTLVAAGTDL